MPTLSEKCKSAITKVLSMFTFTDGNVNVKVNDSVDVFIQDQTTNIVEHFLYRELNAVTPTADITKGQNTVTFQAGHGFADTPSDRNYFNLHYYDPALPPELGSRFSQHGVVAVTGDTVTFTPPFSYDASLTNIERSQRVSVNMNLNGSLVSPFKFETRPPTGSRWDITRFIADMITATQPDDALFGNLPQLTNGVYFGFESDLLTQYQLSVFDNGGYRATAYDVTYSVRSGGQGSWGVAVRKTSAGQDKLGVSIRLDPATNDKLVKYIQDDLTGLARYRVKVMGHLVD